MLALILVLFFPAPCPAPQAEPPVGTWFMDWGSYRQTVEFHADGRYECVQCGGVDWWESDGVIIFSERGVLYALQMDWRALTGKGWRCGCDGPEFSVKVRFTRRQ